MNNSHARAEFSRYLISGLVATLGNVGAIWAVRQVASYELAVAVGAIVGTTISFLNTKFLVFSSAKKSFDFGEIVRFLTVHGAGIVQIWIVSVFLANYLFIGIFSTNLAESIASIVGIGSMVVTSYFGHRYYTYRRGSGK